MLRVLSRDQIRELDRVAIARCGVPSLVLMENAGRGASDVIVRELGSLTRVAQPRVAIVCGSGNNGGDGYVVARRLKVCGVSVEVLAATPVERLSGDAAVNHRAFVGVGGEVRALPGAEPAEWLSRADLLVDAVFGTGLDRPIDGAARPIIEAMNAAPASRVALDIPSGIDADSGRVLGVAVRAQLTITFAAYKRGLLTPEGRAHTGALELVDIGVPVEAIPEVGESALLLEAKDVAQALPRRAVNAHKGSSGRVLVLAGSAGKIGAALLVAHGALRGGAGLVTIAAARAAADALDRRVLEAMTARFDPGALSDTLTPLLERADCVAIGPGLGLDETARAIVEHVVLGHPGPVVVDADAISHFKERPEAIASAAGPRVLTPHPAELGRLLGKSASEVEADRYRALDAAVGATRATVLLKGPHTLVGAPGRTAVVGRAGTGVLATGGAGDVLSGIVAALACAVEPTVAAYVAAFLHARAAELWAADSGADRGLLAHEIADWLPRARAELSGDHSVLPV